MNRGNGARRVALLAVGAAVVMVVSACPRRVVYDPELEAASADWSAKIGAFIASAEERAGTPGGTYESNKEFYEEVQKSIGGQVERTQTASGSQQAIEILQLLSKDIENLRQLHESGGESGLSQAVAGPARTAIETELRALKRLQDEYKGGMESPN